MIHLILETGRTSQIQRSLWPKRSSASRHFLASRATAGSPPRGTAGQEPRNISPFFSSAGRWKGRSVVPMSLAGTNDAASLAREGGIDLLLTSIRRCPRRADLSGVGRSGGWARRSRTKDKILRVVQSRPGERGSEGERLIGLLTMSRFRWVLFRLLLPVLNLFHCWKTNWGMTLPCTLRNVDSVKRPSSQL